MQALQQRLQQVSADQVHASHLHGMPMSVPVPAAILSWYQQRRAPCLVMPALCASSVAAAVARAFWLISVAMQWAAPLAARSSSATEQMT